MLKQIVWGVGLLQEITNIRTVTTGAPLTQDPEFSLEHTAAIVKDKSHRKCPMLLVDLVRFSEGRMVQASEA